MSVEVIPDPVTRDDWLATRENGHAEVAAYIPADLQHGRAPLSVFWRGQIDRQWLSATVEHASTLWRDLRYDGGVKAIAFGERQKEIHSRDLGRYLAESAELDGYPAYRVEFHLNTQSGPAEMLIWANVAESDQRSLDEGGENAGIAVSAALFDQAVRTLISRAIARTRHVEDRMIAELFGAISTNIAARGHHFGT